MKLAKNHVDFGLYTERREEMLEFWQGSVGLPFEELLPAGRGVHQLRHAMNGSVMKINHSRDPLPDAPPAGYAELLDGPPGSVGPTAPPQGLMLVAVRYPPGTVEWDDA